MKREEIMIMLLAGGGGGKLTASHLQKALYMLCRAYPQTMPPKKAYRFAISPNGPFSREAYADLNELRKDGLVEVGKTGDRRYYDLTDKGRHIGKLCFVARTDGLGNLVERMSLFARHLSEDNLHGILMEWFPDLDPDDEKAF